MAACLASLALLQACQTSNTPTQDCSGMFESRSATGARINKKVKTATEEMPATECKVLEIKLDNNNKCEIVGSDKMDNLSQILSEERNDRIVLITPASKVRDLGRLAQSYMPSASKMDLSKHFDSDMFKNMNFPYKGMKCHIAGKKVVIWASKKQVILTVQ